MEYNSKDLQLQYQGFLQTPFLWFRKGVFDLQQFENQNNKVNFLDLEIQQKLRLGKLVERFVSFELQQNSSIKIVSENTQIQENKITLGELDCLLLKDDKPIHLEIIYKFYLYDESVGNSEIEHWIGPNRRDSLIQKITKLKEKQLPLLYSKQCRKYLEEFNLTSEEIEQQVYFKAQLFVPLKDVRKQFSVINNECISGFYINRKELLNFTDCKFHIPNKHNWLIAPHKSINWLKFEDFYEKLKAFLINEKSPLCWLKKSNGELHKIFIVWW